MDPVAVKLIDRLVKREGGYLVHTVPGDAGGTTYAGISSKYWPQWPGWQWLQYGYHPESPEMKNAVYAFYQQEFLDKMGYPHRWPYAQEFAPLAESVFDTMVLNGPVRALKWLQEALVALCAEKAPIQMSIDGVFGPKCINALGTLAAIMGPNTAAVALEAVLMDCRVDRFIESVKKRPVNEKFFKGWVTRAAALTGEDPMEAM